MSKVEKYPELVELLTSISHYGFTVLQAKAYINLLELGESTGSAIAEASGINRSKIYDALKDLENMKAVRRVSRENKTRYIALPPDKVFESILGQFTERLNVGREKLNELSRYFQYLSEEVATLTTLEFSELNLNRYRYVLTSDERTSGRLIESVTPSNRPGEHVLILPLGIEAPPELVLLVSDEEVLLFNLPVGKVIENVLKLEGGAMGRFMQAVIDSSWFDRLPEFVKEEVESGKRRMLYTGLALFMEQKMMNALHYSYSRPVQFLISDAHISFFYQGVEDHKVPVMSIKEVKVGEDRTITCTLHTPRTGEELGKLVFRVLKDEYAVYGILETLSRRS